MDNAILDFIQFKRRVNPFCVISKNTYNEHSLRDIQTNSAWEINPYGDKYAVVPDDMVQDIIKTKGYCDIELNEDGTEVISFTPLQIPEFNEPIKELSMEDRLKQLESDYEILNRTLFEHMLSCRVYNENEQVSASSMFLSKNIIKGNTDYGEVIYMRPQLKDEIDMYLKAQNREDLIQ